MQAIKEGTTFGFLTTISSEFIPAVNSRGDSNPHVRCRCICGNERLVSANNLKRGNSTSCGCKRKGNLTHGHSGTRLYTIWACMLDRCRRESNKAYKWYGGKGIIVCEEWSSFEIFKQWADANGYTDDLTIDRKDSSKGYYPDNCQWISLVENNRKRAKKIIREDGVIYDNADEVAKLYGWHPQSVRQYIRRGLTIAGKIFKNYEG